MMLRTWLLAIGLAAACCVPSIGYATRADVPQRAWWVWFRDKGPEVRTPDDNAPVYPAYLDAVQRIAPVRHTTRWFNGVSVLASEDQLPALWSLPFVREVSPVLPLRGERPRPGGDAEPAQRPTLTHGLDYGSSLTQNQLVRADSLHRLGLDGHGILVAILDAGFSYLNHPALAGAAIKARRDFVDGDTIIAGDTHGSEVLSCLAGYSPGNLIGPAYGAQFALARTEYGPTESRSEEDYWLAGAEWADSLGARVISSSVGYNYFDDPATNYALSDLDGKTSVITRAAQKAAGRGIVVVNCAGNEHSAGSAAYWQGKILMPSDGDSVIAVGAVTSGGSVTYFSSFGPTADGRIKPDIAALGAAVFMVNGTSTYTWNNGTSFAAPVVAGVVAQLLQAHPAWDPIAVRTALRLSGTRNTAPDTTIGWGVIDAVRALAAENAVFGKVTGDLSGGPVNETTLSILTESGTLVRSSAVSSQGWFVQERLAPGTYRVRAALPRLMLVAETTLVLPMLPREIHLGLKPSNGVASPTPTERFWVSEPHPNPANPGTSITYRLPDDAAGQLVRVRIATVTGQMVREIVIPAHKQGGMFTWDGTDGTGRSVAAGVYVIQVSVGAAAVVRRATILR